MNETFPASSNSPSRSKWTQAKFEKYKWFQFSSGNQAKFQEDYGLYAEVGNSNYAISSELERPFKTQDNSMLVAEFDVIFEKP